MTIKTSRVDFKTLAAGVAVVGALAFAPTVSAQTGASQPGQPGGAGQQQYGQQYGQPGQAGQQYGQPGQAGQQEQLRDRERLGQMGGQPGDQGGTGQQQYGQPGETQQRLGQPGQAEQQQWGQTGQQQPGQGMGATGQPDRQPMGARGSTEGQVHVSSESVRHIQEALNERGHDLEVDGKWGPQTSSAIREFQQKEGLEATGQLDNATQQALGVAQ